MDKSRGESPAERTQPGPVYDAAMRGLMEGDPAAACRLLGVEVVGEPKVLPSVFSASSLTVDLLLRVAPGRLVHVEYVRAATRDLVTRMLGYRWVVMRDHPDDLLSQHVVVLGEGRVRGHDDPARTGFWLDLNVVYLREVEAARLLADVSLAPLAALGRGSPSEAYAQSLRVACERGGARAGRLIQFATTLATITMDPSIIWKFVGEVGMSVESIADLFVADLFRDTKFGQALIQQGLDTGREEGREHLLVALLRDRFGPHPDLPAVAQRLASWPDAASIQAITAAASLDELARAQPPIG
jgi:hypothetical protein